MIMIISQPQMFHARLINGNQIHTKKLVLNWAASSIMEVQQYLEDYLCSQTSSSSPSHTLKIEKV
jgi:hypothetical protein